MRVKFLWSWLRSMWSIWIFICFISKQCGVHTGKMTMTVRLAFMLITGKIIGGSLHFTATHTKCVKIGKPTKSSPQTPMDVRSSINVVIRMDGKSKSTTRNFLRLKSANIVRDVRRSTAPIIIQRMIKEHPWQAGSIFSQKLELIHSARTFTSQLSATNRTRWQTSKQVLVVFRLRSSATSKNCETAHLNPCSHPWLRTTRTNSTPATKNRIKLPPAIVEEAPTVVVPGVDLKKLIQMPMFISDLINSGLLRYKATPHMIQAPRSTRTRTSQAQATVSLIAISLKSLAAQAIARWNNINTHRRKNKVSGPNSKSNHFQREVTSDQARETRIHWAH